MKKLMALLLCLALLCGCGAGSEEAEPLERTAAWLQEHVADPQVAHMGGEWTVLGLARSGLEIPGDYFAQYYETLTAYTEECRGELDSRKYTEYSRVVLALTALGKNPADVGGYDLLQPLGDYDKTVYQGINGCIFALIALDSGGYGVPENPQAASQATRERYLQLLLERELPNGGWTLAGDTAEPDLTAMALQALCAYTDRAEVQSAVERGLNVLSQMQNDEGGFSFLGVESCESSAQVIVALTSLGIPLDDSRFVKNGKTAMDGLLRFAQQDGSFAHALDGTGTNLMATEQAFYALVAARRAESGLTPLYDMSDVEK